METLLTIVFVPIGAAISGAFVALWQKLNKKDETILELSRDNIALATAAKEDARDDVAQLMKAVDAIKVAAESVQSMAKMREDIIEIRSLLEGKG
ncbi:hypothetical protein [Henriciella aquimarina]|uniref:hypothetical protein n=1 Tax=Henriciella aquimarina TaxID=545261 RepID=UPI00117AE2CB|nr:hypothetical protein [Henriciella aquimarina]